MNCSVLTDKRELETLVSDNICIYGNQSFWFQKKFNSNVIRIILRKAFIKPYIPMVSVLNPFSFFALETLISPVVSHFSSNNKDIYQNCHMVRRGRQIERCL